MLRHAITRRYSLPGAAMLGLALAACADSSAPSSVAVPHIAAQQAARNQDATAGDPNAGAGDTKAFIGAWLDGRAVQLRYTRSFFCEEPPESIADTGCEIGALPEDFPRGGRIPTIYALAPVGFTPTDPSTLHCSLSAPCANHPPMIDVTRLNLPFSVATRPPHSHIITSQQAGWHKTINIRVLSSWAWDQIAAAPTLETVRNLRANYPTLISKEYPTNIFFFFEVRTQTPAP